MCTDGKPCTDDAEQHEKFKAAQKFLADRSNHINEAFEFAVATNPAMQRILRECKPGGATAMRKIVRQFYDAGLISALGMKQAEADGTDGSDAPDEIDRVLDSLPFGHEFEEIIMHNAVPGGKTITIKAEGKTRQQLKDAIRTALASD